MTVRRVASTLLLPLATVGPANGQTILDTVHQLRSTIGQLGGRRQVPSTSNGRPAPSTGTSAPNGDGLVPASALADDASDTALEREPLVQRRVATFDVRGFRLGMSPREVGRIADREGFRRRPNDTLLTTGSFEVEAARLANQRLNRPMERTSSLQLKVVQGSDPAGNRMSLEFTLEPDGPRLSRLEYRARLDGSSRSQAVAALLRRYGPTRHPQDGTGADALVWTDSKAPLDNSSPVLIAGVDDDAMSVTLRQSVDYGQAARKRLEARAQQLAAARGGGVRF